MPKADGVKTKSAHKSGNETPVSGFLIARGDEMNSSSPAALPGAPEHKGRLFSGAAGHRRVILYVVGVIVAVFAVLAPTLFYQAPTAELRVGSHQISMEIAETDVARAKGLSGRESLPADKGMLAVFGEAGKRCFWMKGMRFPLDMVFVSHAKRVVQIQPNVSPKTYPKNFCADDVQYVIELHTGTAQTLGLRDGQRLSF